MTSNAHVPNVEYELKSNLGFTRLNKQHRSRQLNHGKVSIDFKGLISSWRYPYMRYIQGVSQFFQILKNLLQKN